MARPPLISVLYVGEVEGGCSTLQGGSDARLCHMYVDLTGAPPVQSVSQGCPLGGGKAVSGFRGRNWHTVVHTPDSKTVAQGAKEI